MPSPSGIVEGFNQTLGALVALIDATAAVLDGPGTFAGA